MLNVWATVRRVRTTGVLCWGVNIGISIQCTHVEHITGPKAVLKYLWDGWSLVDQLCCTTRGDTVTGARCWADSTSDPSSGTSLPPCRTSNLKELDVTQGMVDPIGRNAAIAYKLGPLVPWG